MTRSGRITHEKLKKRDPEFALAYEEWRRLNGESPQSQVPIRNQMWHPENSIRHQLPDTRWPTAKKPPRRSCSLRFASGA